MAHPADLRYTPEHEWARREGEHIAVGITSYATEQLGDVVFVELPAVGKQLDAMKPFGVVEAVKTVSDLFAPLAGEVVAVNEALTANPALVNQSPYGEGWMIRIRPNDPAALDQLMSNQDYEHYLEEHHA